MVVETSDSVMDYVEMVVRGGDLVLKLQDGGSWIERAQSVIP